MPGSYKAFRDIQKRVSDAETFVTRVGIMDDEEAARRGRYAEYGTRTAPARPWISATMRGRRSEIVAYQKKLARQIIAGTIDGQRYAELLGKYVAKLLRETITKYGPLIFAPLAESTIRRKGHDRPLIHTRRMLRAIKYAVRARAG